jgi:hypothetical protein
MDGWLCLKCADGDSDILNFVKVKLLQCARTSKYAYTILLSLDLAPALTTLVKYLGTALPIY